MAYCDLFAMWKLRFVEDGRPIPRVGGGPLKRAYGHTRCPKHPALPKVRTSVLFWVNSNFFPPCPCTGDDIEIRGGEGCAHEEPDGEDEEEKRGADDEVTEERTGGDCQHGAEAVRTDVAAAQGQTGRGQEGAGTGGGK